MQGLVHTKSIELKKDSMHTGLYPHGNAGSANHINIGKEKMETKNINRSSFDFTYSFDILFKSFSMLSVKSDGTFTGSFNAFDNQYCFFSLSPHFLYNNTN